MHPTTSADPRALTVTRTRRPENEEQPIHKLFSYCYVADGQEGLIVVDIHTLVDGNPSNNFLTRAVTFNPDGILNGAVYARVAGPAIRARVADAT